MWTVIGTIAIVAATMGLGVAIERRWGPRRLAEGARAKLLHGPGDAPETAIRASAGEIELLRRQKCPRCRKPLDVGAEDRVTFGDGELLVLRFVCLRCGTVRSVYVTEATA